MKLRKRIVMVAMMIVICMFSSITNATFSINKASLYKGDRCKYVFKNKYNGGLIGAVKVFYNYNGKTYPAYCINRELDGVGEVEGYDVTVSEAINNPLVWRVIVNGYPYKSFEELGVADEDEAFTATKQAVYCVLYGNDKNNFYMYDPIGEAGTRTLNAMKTMVNNARSSTQVKPSSNININQITNWQIDNTNEYISKTFEISAEANIQSYNISITNDKEKQIKVTDLNGKEITNEVTEKRFKVMIPVCLLEKDDKFELKVSGKVETYPILYGASNNVKYQNYALAGEIFEIGEGNLTVNYSKNSSKLKIIKQDESGEERLKGVEFQIWNDKNEVVYSNLKTNENGEILLEGILPGKYFLEEVNSIDGYKKLENKIEFELTLNEELKITVKNPKDEPEIKKEIKEKNQTYSEKMNKLPVTGM